MPADPNPLKKFKENQARTNRLIMDGVKDHVVPHIAEKSTSNDMWVTLEAMYQGSSVQRKNSLRESDEVFPNAEG